MASIATTAKLMPVTSVETWSRTLASTDGRDKLFRLIQYACRLIRGFETGMNGRPITMIGQRVAALEAALGTSRQMWRLFKWTNVWAKQYKTTNDGGVVLDVLGALSDLGLFLYYLFDNLTFVHKVGLVKGNVPTASQRAGKFWLLSTLASLASAIYKLVLLEKNIRQMKQSLTVSKDETVNSEAVVELDKMNRRKNILLSIAVKNLSDSVIAGNLARTNKLHPALTGVCGVISSIVGCYQVWPRYESTG